MKKIMGLGAMLLAGLLVIPGNLGLRARSWPKAAKTTEDEQLQGYGRSGKAMGGA